MEIPYPLMRVNLTLRPSREGFLCHHSGEFGIGQYSKMHVVESGQVETGTVNEFNGLMMSYGQEAGFGFKVEMGRNVLVMTIMIVPEEVEHKEYIREVLKDLAPAALELYEEWKADAAKLLEIKAELDLHLKKLEGKWN